MHLDTPGADGRSRATDLEELGGGRPVRSTRSFPLSSVNNEFTMEVGKELEILLLLPSPNHLINKIFYLKNELILGKKRRMYTHL